MIILWTDQTAQITAKETALTRLGTGFPELFPAPTLLQWESQLFTDYDSDITWQTFWPKLNV